MRIRQLFVGITQLTSSPPLLAGEAGCILANPQRVMAHIQAGKLRALAVTGAQRLDAIPTVPTLKEAGVAGVEVTTRFGLWAPRQTPAAAVERLNAAARKDLAVPEVRRQLAAQPEA
jgi:tripartite-type tricarboxylate transporter receptor subunit TctC